MKRGVVAMAALLLAATAQAGLHRWVDAQGNVHFSDRPKTEIPPQVLGMVSPEQREAAERAAEARHMAAEEQRLREQMESSGGGSVDSVSLRRQCGHARNVLQRYETAGLLYTDAADGGYRVLRRAERAKLISQLRQEIAGKCG